MNKFVIVLFLTILSACSRSPTINLHSRTFGSTPKNVIWIQLPGFDLEHISLIRFGSSDSRRPVNLENVDCVGSAWSYNFYDIRTSASDSTLSQLTGSPDIKNSCAPDVRYPAWQYYRSLGFTTIALEHGISRNTSLLSNSQCTDGKFLDGLTLLTMQPVVKGTKDPQFFHYQSKNSLDFGKIHWDQTCGGGPDKCFATLSSNVKAMWEGATNKGNGVFFLIRDFSYIDQLKNGNPRKATEILSEVDKIIAFFKEQPSADQTLILMTGGESLSLRFPSRGKEWMEFEKRGKNISFERSKLMSPVLADGPSAENFCGVYEESKILYRQFWRDDNSGFSLEKLIELRNL